MPNPSTIINLIPQNSKFYTVIDLCAAFFSIPIHTDSQDIFTFTWMSGQLTWTRLPRGFTGLLTIFSLILVKDLQDIKLPGQSVLIQYVDDLLIASPDSHACKINTLALLTALADKGHKVSPYKLQFCKSKVEYLGYILEETN